MMIFKSLCRISITLITLSVFTSCSEDSSTAPPAGNDAPLAKFSELKAKVFVNCTGAQCHSSAGNQGNLILEPDAAYNNLVGVQSVLYPQFKRVEPGNSSNSLLIKILRGEVNPRMPLVGNPLPDATIDSIAKWIDLGALNN
jgi:hypothetical protein